ncbi:hypothetical protein [Paracoccus sp. S3-43]|uniref:hypothetical protein n=1 Tax=Paracoccus sp. S3-43 TaxID=3030011 RepID=UPI0023B02749|nr:hypothetical protein [Paracoccus sp. S3-43]WEF24902.1 hypothetical protein PXD02_02795 [Paracoccus sp. S3-43]
MTRGMRRRAPLGSDLAPGAAIPAPGGLWSGCSDASLNRLIGQGPGQTAQF